MTAHTMFVHYIFYELCLEPELLICGWTLSILNGRSCRATSSTISFQVRYHWSDAGSHEMMCVSKLQGLIEAVVDQQMADAGTPKGVPD